MDMSILPGSYLSVNQDLRIIAYSKDPQDVRGWSIFVSENFKIYALEVYINTYFILVSDFFTCSFYVY